MSSPVLPYIMRVLTSQGLRDLRRRRAEKRRLRSRQPHRATVYLRINDPYSYVLLQVLESLAERFSLEYDFRTVLNLQPDMYPAPAMWERNAFQDGGYLAALYGLEFPAARPATTPRRDAQLTAQLLHWELQPGYLGNALALFRAYWQDDSAQLPGLLDARVTGNVECYQHHLRANENLLKSSGHYLSGMLRYGGEWYWGLDRLEHLERRLNELGLARGGARVEFDKGYRDFCRLGGADQVPEARRDTPIVNYFSIRSPYSYLGLVRARQLAAHYHIPLVVKPVLPMVMRRMQVPRTKGSYIFGDVKREAQKYGIDFGFTADPLGKGVERCYALYDFARAAGKGHEFLERYPRGVWAEGIRSDTDAGLKQLVERVGLDWQQARGLLGSDAWRLWAQENLAELYSIGLWGVPSFSYGELRVFGQDRLDCIERAIVSGSGERAAG
ncbi:MAG: DsbA family protein [Gammaproteobacteria bacterium]|nr:DsbA family protein [Gammaproteobacteria bacterium]